MGVRRDTKRAAAGHIINQRCEGAQPLSPARAEKEGEVRSLPERATKHKSYRHLKPNAKLESYLLTAARMFAKNVDVAHQPRACAAAVTFKAAAESAQIANVHDPLPVSMALTTPG